MDSPDFKNLSGNHLQLIKGSAISPAVARERGYRTIDSILELEKLGFAQSQRLVPGLLIPLYGVDGRLFGYQLRPDQPRILDRRVAKYEILHGLRMAIDVPPRCHPSLADPAIPLFITEGVRKADSAVSQSLCCIDLLGVWGWRGTNDKGGKIALPDWENIALNGRTAFIVFDNDVMTKRPVYLALTRLKRFLESRGVKVLVIHLPEEL
jgi:Domain of unknown function (DUF3854)